MGEKVSFQSLYEQMKFAGAGDFAARFEEYLLTARAVDALIPVDLRYIYIEALLTATRIIQEAGGNPRTELKDILKPRDPAFFSDEERVLSACRAALGKAISIRDFGRQLRGNSAVNRACQYLDTHYTDSALSFQEVVNYVSLSPSHFSTLFAQSSGMTFTRYLINLRLRKACELLHHTDMRSSEIAYAVGFNDPHYFSHLFKKNTGQTPGEYRSSFQSRKEKKE